MYYSSDAPYPEIAITEENSAYGGAMLDNAGGTVSEMSAVSLYFYNHLITPEYAEVSEAFHEINIVEMHHLEIFGELAYKLGENPRLWSQRGIQKKYWSPCYNRYPVQIHSILENSLSGELMAIKKYEMQCRAIANTNITDILKRIIADEEVHVEIFKKLIEKY